MHLDFASLLGAMTGLRLPGKSKGSPPRRNRKLLGEQLETRYALSTVLGDGTTIVDPAPPPPDTALTSTVLSPSDSITLDPSLLDPPPMDPPPPPPPVNTPPQIVDFTAQIVDNWCTLLGRVVDDVDPTGLTVTLDGVVVTTRIVDEDDFFSYVFELPPQYHGTIVAFTTDIGGLASNIASVTI